MREIKVSTITAESMPKSKKNPETHLYNMMFVMPEDMGQEWVAARVKGTGKPSTLPDDMCLVWSLTHDAWRTLNARRVLHIDSFKIVPESFDAVRQAHQECVDSMPEAIRAYWGR